MLWLCLVAVAALPVAASEVAGLVGKVVRVADGDGLKVQLSSGPVTVRLFGIDAPELRQTGGREARDALKGRVNGRQVWLDVQDQDRYDRLTATVWLEGEDINGWLVDQGHAWAYRRYLREPDYCYREHAARGAGRGVWARSARDLYAPWEYRHLRIGEEARVTAYRDETLENCIAALAGTATPLGRPAPAQPSQAMDAPGPPSGPQRAPGSCLIKGNISPHGRIYHLPGSAAYAGTVINVTRGERWFCTAREAEDAGWRAPR